MMTFDEFLVFFGFRTPPTGVEKVESVLFEFDRIQQDLSEGLEDIDREIVNRKDSIERRRQAFEAYRDQQQAQIESLANTGVQGEALLEGLRQLTNGVNV